MSLWEMCHVVDQGCWGIVVKSKCFACGLHVCVNCSSRRQYFNYGRRRICNTCQIDIIDGNADIVNRRMEAQNS